MHQKSQSAEKRGIPTAYCENTVINLLKKLFPNGFIHADEFARIDPTLSMSIRKYARNCGMTYPDWLRWKGFIWGDKNTGYLETDMQVYSPNKKSSSSNSDIFALVDNIFQTSPLLGEYILSEDEEKLLYQAAGNVFRKLFIKDSVISSDECDLLILGTIQRLKNWASDSVTEETDSSFWEYIFRQYGFNSGNSGSVYFSLCQKFRELIQKSFRNPKHPRFLSSQNTQKYYTSMLLHALAPKQSIYSLFEILLDFYSKNLDYQYIPVDPSYKQFVKNLQKRWNSHAAPTDDFQLRSDAIFSGLKALFLERPGYSAALCEQVVQKIDALLRSEGEQYMDPARNYWDFLLSQWYQEKSSVEKSRIQTERRDHKTEFIATSPERINIQYALNNEQIGLSIPRIRLPEFLDSMEGDRHPSLKIYQDEHLIYQTTLSVTGNICLTTRSLFIPLCDTRYDFSLDPSILVEIHFCGNLLYSSDNRLNRTYVLLDSTGKSRLPSKGIAYLFASTKRSIAYDRTGDVYLFPHPGQLYSINLDTISTLTLDSVEIFSDRVARSNFRLHTSLQPYEKIQAISQEKNVPIFPAPFSITLYFPENESKLRYQISIDGTRYPVSQFLSGTDEIHLNSSDDDGVIHCIRIVDLQSGYIQYEFTYTVLRNCSLRFAKSIYRPAIDPVSAVLSIRGKEEPLASMLEFGADQLQIQIPDLPFLIGLEVPVIQGSFLEQSIFQLPEVIWHQKVAQTEAVKIQLPKGWGARLDLGDLPVSRSPFNELVFELGNDLQACSSQAEKSALTLTLYGPEKQIEKFLITQIAFTPQFHEAPLKFSNRSLYWKATDNFIGDPQSQFEIRFSSSLLSSLSLKTDTQDHVLATDTVLSDGLYPYQIFLTKKSLFQNSTSQKILDGVLVVGTPESFIFSGKELILGNALCWDSSDDQVKSISMRPGFGIVANMQYCGYSIASGENSPAPHYTAVLYFQDGYGRRHTFNSVPQDEFELINPVHVWIINEHLLILRCVTEDAVCIDARYRTIVNRIPTMTRSEQLTRLLLPDYFEYETKEVYHHV